jgi:hypothetical protein
MNHAENVMPLIGSPRLMPTITGGRDIGYEKHAECDLRHCVCTMFLILFAF